MVRDRRLSMPDILMSSGTALRLPSFIHVGPPRTGTTWLHEVLTGHIGLPSEKETRFFDARYDRGVEWYCNLFVDYPADVPAGEMGPTYFSNAVARERIKFHIPECKIIITFREPAARLYSLYRLLRSERRPTDDTFDGYWSFQINCGADLCSYATQLKRWQATFGKSRVLVLFYEYLRFESARLPGRGLRFYRSAPHCFRSLQGRKRKGIFGSYCRPLQCDRPAHGRGCRLGFSPWRASID